MAAATAKLVLTMTALLAGFPALSPVWALGSGEASAQVSAGAVDRPATVADDFHRAFESMVWRAAAQRIHPDALATFRHAVGVLVESEARSDVLERLLGGVDRATWEAMEDAEVFRRVMEALMEETPGLLHALSTRRHEVVGPVADGPDTVHVVYRLIPSLQGAPPEVKVMTLSRAGGPAGPWRVARADELDSVLAALRGLPVRRPAPGGG